MYVEAQGRSRTVCRVAFTKQFRQVGNLVVGLVLIAVGVIALLNAGGTQSRGFAVFLLLVGIGAIYLAVRAMRRRT